MDLTGDYVRGGIADWRDFVATAGLVRSSLGVSPSAWEEAVGVMRHAAPGDLGQGQAPAHRRRRVRTAGPQSPAGAQRRLDRVAHAVRRIFRAAGRVVEVVGDEAQDQPFRGRPGLGGAARGERLGLEIGEVRGHGPKRVGPHALAGEVAQSLDLAVTEELSQPVAAAPSGSTAESAPSSTARRDCASGG